MSDTIEELSGIRFGRSFSSKELKLMMGVDDFQFFSEEEIKETLKRHKEDPMGRWYEIDKSDDSNKPFELRFWEGNNQEWFECNYNTELFCTLEEAKDFGDRFVNGNLTLKELGLPDHMIEYLEGKKNEC